MSIISAGNTVTTSLKQTADTSGNLVFTTGGNNTVALTIDSNQQASFVNAVNITVLSSSTGVINAASATGALILPSGNGAQRTVASVAGALQIGRAHV